MQLSKTKFFNLVKGKEIFLIYLFSYFTFLLLNNLIVWLSRLILFGILRPHFHFFGRWCLIPIDHALKYFFIFIFLKLVFIISIYTLDKLKTIYPYKRIIGEICISYFLFDAIYLILTPIASFLHFESNWYFFSLGDQLLISKISTIPEYALSICWLLVLFLFILKTEFKNLNLSDWILRITGVLISFIFFSIVLTSCLELSHYILRAMGFASNCKKP